jgi:hypothetical protein
MLIATLVIVPRTSLYLIGICVIVATRNTCPFSMNLGFFIIKTAHTREGRLGKKYLGRTRSIWSKILHTRIFPPFPFTSQKYLFFLVEYLLSPST